MDVYEFTVALRRQRVFLLVGAVVLIAGILALTFKFGPEGIEPRLGPDYTATVKYVVTSGEVEALAVAPIASDAMAPTAQFFVSLLLAPEAARDIAESTGVPIEGLVISSEGAVITAVATAATEDGATTLALATHSWLTERLERPLELVPVTPESDSSVLDAEGQLLTDIVIDVSPAYIDTGDGVWLGVTVDERSVKTVSLIDAAIEDSVATDVTVQPGGEIDLRLENVNRDELDVTRISVPELADDLVPAALVIRIDRGGIVGLPPAPSPEQAQPARRDVSGAAFVPTRLDASWLRSDGAITDPSLASIGVSLLTENPIAEETGTRRGPILAIAALLGGAFALLVGAIAIDSWRQAKRNHATAVYTERTTIIRPMTTRYEGSGPLSHRLRSAGEPPRGTPPVGAPLWPNEPGHDDDAAVR